MAIDVEWIDQSGNVLARCDGPRLTAEIVWRCPSTSVCLRFIDPYGDTIFNQLQIEVLAEELAATSEAAPLLDFVGRKRGEPHTYLKFIGD